MKELLLKALAPHGVTKVEVDRQADLHGRPAFGVTVWFTRDECNFWGAFNFAKDNNMSTKMMADVIASHIHRDKFEKDEPEIEPVTPRKE